MTAISLSCSTASSDFAPPLLLPPKYLILEILTPSFLQYRLTCDFLIELSYPFENSVVTGKKPIMLAWVNTMTSLHSCNEPYNYPSRHRCARGGGNSKSTPPHWRPFLAPPLESISVMKIGTHVCQNLPPPAIKMLVCEIHLPKPQGTFFTILGSN